MEREHESAPTPQEVEAVEQEQETAVEVQEKPERLRFDQLPKEEQEKALGIALEQIRQAIGSVEDYAVFASTAMYLNGERIVNRGDENGRELMAPPGDFDAAVFSEESLDEIRRRLGSMPNVEFDNDGKYIRMVGEEARKLAGKMVIEIEKDAQKKEVEYDFEFFYRTFIVPKELAEGHTVQQRGLKALDLEGLQRQYQKNLRFETAIDENVTQIVQFLDGEHEEAIQLKQEVAAGELSGESERILDHLKVSAEEVRQALALHEEIKTLEERQAQMRQKIVDLQKMQASYEELSLFDKAHEQQLIAEDLAKEVRQDWKKTQELISKRATVLAGTKTKIWKRQLNILQLAKVRGR